MHIWYKLICRECGEGIDFYVDTPSRTEVYLSKYDEEIYKFLMEHGNCKLELIHSDFDMDKLWEEGWEFDGPPDNRSFKIKRKTINVNKR